MDNTKIWIWLQLVFGVANPRVWSVLNQFDNVEDAYITLKSGEFKNLTQKEAKSVLLTTLEEAESIINHCESKGYNIVTYEDENYPDLLKGVYNAPIVLYCMGDISILNKNMTITVVGTRKPSSYSVNVAERICSELSRVGIILVSGFANGIDSMAHQAALKNSGITAAVLGCGLDVDYPKNNYKAKKIIARNGVVISEYFPATPPNAPNFPKRNRILSGLSVGTLIIEAANGSGSLITAECAIEQGRDVFCVPPANIFDNRYAGVIKYLRDGAIPTFSHLDIIYEYYTNFSHKLLTADLTSDYYEQTTESVVYKKDKVDTADRYVGNGKSGDAGAIKEEKSIKNKDIDVKTSVSPVKDIEKVDEIDYSELSDEQVRVIEIIKNGTKYADEISYQLNMQIHELFAVLTELEIMGIVKSLPGKAYDIVK
ncbi:MAG: DNA-protecting protein DprA [Clostridiales bacterium]|jgi:DNA processing protein|nr:DNA-protecting protein DprA [Clostridiales bacterium]